MDPEVMKSYLPLYRDALFLTMRIGWQGVLLALVLGLVCAAVLQLKLPFIRRIVAVYVELFRATPMVVQIFVIFYVVFDGEGNLATTHRFYVPWQ